MARLPHRKHLPYEYADRLHGWPLQEDAASQEVAAYWQYIEVLNKCVRPSFAILHEKVYPADHEFWNRNYPPTGFRCRCTVRTLSEPQVKNQGLTVETEMPKDGV